MTSNSTITGERADLIGTLRHHRDFLRFTVRELTEEQARQRSTVSALTLASLIKHVADTEHGWAEFIVAGPAALGGDVDWDATGADWSNVEDPRFVLGEQDTLPRLLAHYADVAQRTDELAATVDLDATQALPKAPWFEPGAQWSARRCLLHILAETAQHAGHADIIREALDGAKTMG
jgi:uncharacterized damage-inducible protein DinB